MKKILMWLIVVLMTIAGAVSAMAQAVQETPPPPTKPDFGYDGGFYIKTADNTFKFTVNGRIQPLYYFQKNTGAEAVSTFKIRRAYIKFSSVLATKGHSEISLLYSTSSAKFQQINLYTATAGYKFSDAIDLTIGTVGMPLGMIVSSLGFHLIEAPIAISRDDAAPLTPLRSAFGNPDGIGIELNGDIGKFSYDFSVVNGAAQAKPAVIGKDVNGKTITISEPSGGVETNYDLSFKKRVSSGIRLSYNILDAVNIANQMDMPYSKDPKLTVSIGANYQGKRTDPNTNADIKYLLTGSAGVAFRWRGWSVTTEAFGRKTRISNRGQAIWFSPTLDDFGYYLDSGYFIVPDKFEVAVQVSQIFREGPHNNSYEVGGGLIYYIKGNNLKAQLTYTLSGVYDDVTNTDTTKINYIGTMLTANF